MKAFRRSVFSLCFIVSAAGSVTSACSNDATAPRNESGGRGAVAGGGTGGNGGQSGGTGTGGGAAQGGRAGGAAGAGGAGGAGSAGRASLGGSAGASGAVAGAAGSVAAGGVLSGGQSGAGTDAGRGAGAQAGGGMAGQAGAGAGAGSGGVAGTGGGVGSGTLKIITVGDSITRATCWRAKLWQALNAAHAGHFDLVGTLKSDNGCNAPGYDQDNQGYSSSLLTEVVAGVTNARTCDPTCPTLNDFATAFMTTKPDVALIHYGTNDVWNGKATSDITAGYSQLVDKLRAANENVQVFVAKIIPMNVTDSTCGGCSCSGCSTAIPALNTAIDAWAATKTTTKSPVAVVDQFTGFDANADTKDGVHPNDAGSQKMAAQWGAALEPLF